MSAKRWCSLCGADHEVTTCAEHGDVTSIICPRRHPDNRTFPCVGCYQRDTRALRCAHGTLVRRSAEEPPTGYCGRCAHAARSPEQIEADRINALRLMMAPCYLSSGGPCHCWRCIGGGYEGWLCTPSDVAAEARALRALFEKTTAQLAREGKPNSGTDTLRAMLGAPVDRIMRGGT
jgi:hypothetical protein